MKLSDFERLENPNLISGPEAQDRYGISNMTINRWARSGKLEKHFIGNSNLFYMVDQEKLEQLLLEKNYL